MQQRHLISLLEKLDLVQAELSDNSPVKEGCWGGGGGADGSFRALCFSIKAVSWLKYHP